MTTPRAGTGRPPLDAWRRRFIARVTAVALALQAPFAFGVFLWLSPRLSHGAAAALPLCVLGLFFANVPLWVRLFYWRDSARAGFVRVWLLDVPYTVHLCASMWSGVFGTVALALHGLLFVAGFSPARAAPTMYLLGLHAMGFTLGTYATLVRRFWVRVRRVRVRVKGLAPSLDGLTIAQLSDVHCGPHVPPWFYRHVARRTCALGADLVVLTGDMITDGAGYLDDVRDLVSRLRARDGVFASLGNHDYFGTTEGVAEAMQSGGATLLRNAGVRVTSKRGGALFLAGVDDTWTKRDDLARAMRDRGAHPDEPCVLLAHDPDSFDEAAARDDIDLVLSGHTHAGQLALPFAPQVANLAQLRYRYTSGVYREKNCTLFVHHGIGISGPPARLGAAPEIALLTLTSG